MRRGITTYTTLRAALTSCLVCVLLLSFLATSFLPTLSLALITLSVMPVYLVMTGMIAGFVPLSICTLGTLSCLMLTGGTPLMAFGALYLLPMLLAFVYGVTKRLNFWKTLGAMTGSLFISQILIFVILQRMTDGALYETAANIVADFVSSAPGRDNVFLLFLQAGLLKIPESMADTAITLADNMYVFSEEAVLEMLKQLRSQVSGLLQSVLPSLIVSGSILYSVIGLGLGIFFGQRSRHRRAVRLNEDEQDIPDLDMPPLSKWHIPRPWGLRIGILGLGYFLIYVSEGTLQIVGALMWQVFASCFGLQGLAAIHYSQKMRGTSKFWRIALFVAAFTISFMQTVLIVMGIMDQVTNMRGLRPPLAPRENREE